MSAPYSSWRALGPPRTDPDARLSRKLVGRVWTFVRPYRGLLAGVVVAVVATAALTAVPPLLYRAIIDDAVLQQRIGLLNVLALGLLGVSVAAGAAQVASRWFSSHLGERVIADLRVTLFEHVQRLPFAFFTHNRPGALTNRLTSDLAGGHRAFTETLSRVLETVVGVVVTVGAMLWLHVGLTLLALAVAPLFVVVIRRMRGRLHHLMSRKAEADSGMSSLVTERFQVGGALLTKLLGEPGRERDTFADRAATVRDVGVETAVYSRVFHVGFTLVAAVGISLVYLVGGRLAIGGTLSIGTIVAFSAYLTQLYTPLTMLASARTDLATALVSFQRVFEVLDLDLELSQPDDGVVLDRPAGRVQLDDVWFRYPPPGAMTVPSLVDDDPGTARALDHERRPWVLRAVSLSIAPGQTVALVGPSGAGKTTLTMLIPRLYDATAGAVRVDGHDVRDLAPASLAAAIGVVPQDPHLFHDTVAANLRYANPAASDAEIENAARAARIHDLVASLPEGYDTMVGERGYRFSGGEKQRLAIARVLLQDPAVVVLDEATAHLDSESETLVRRALAEALEGRSSLVIAHRLSTVADADQIVVLDGGRIVESGRHEELLANGGLYAELCRLQLSDRRAPPESPLSSRPDEEPPAAPSLLRDR